MCTKSCVFNVRRSNVFYKVGLSFLNTCLTFVFHYMLDPDPKPVPEPSWIRNRNAFRFRFCGSRFRFPNTGTTTFSLLSTPEEYKNSWNFSSSELWYLLWHVSTLLCSQSFLTLLSKNHQFTRTWHSGNPQLLNHLLYAHPDPAFCCMFNTVRIGIVGLFFIHLEIRKKFFETKVWWYR
jgi:hypothetical protein